jgi:hypothetical protein
MRSIRNFIRLLHQLLGAGDIAERPDRVGTAARDDIDRFAGGAQFGTPLFRLGVHIEAARAVLDPTTEELVQQHVAATQIVAIVGFDPMLQQRGAGHADLTGDRGRLPHMVRLHGTLGDDVSGALGFCLAYQPFQLAYLVPAGRHHGAVVSFDPDFRPAKRSGQIVQPLQRRRRRKQANPWKSGKMHRRSPEGIILPD